jgi:hypothetical protein
MDEPMYKISIQEIENIDPHFAIKIMELTAKLVYGSVGNMYGKGLGFVNYG